MQIDRLFLNDKECDLSPGTVIALTFQINDLAELKDRQANFSQQFKIPKTATNRSILEDAELIQSTTVKPYRKLPARVSKNGIDVVGSGIAILEGSTEDFYSITVYSGLFDFFERIKGKLVSDLDLSDLDHQMDVVTAAALRTNVDGLKYSIIDFGGLVNINRTVDILKLRPTMFFHTIVTRIFSEAGVTPIGNVLSDADYKRILIEMFNTELLLTDITNNDFYDNVGANLALGPWSNAGPLAGLNIPGSPEDWKFKLRIKFKVNAWTVGLSTFTMEIFGVPTTWTFYSHATGFNSTGTFTAEWEHPDNWDGFLSLEIAIINANVDIIDGFWKGTNSNNLSVNFKAHIIAKAGMTSPWSAGLDMVASADPDIIETEHNYLVVADNLAKMYQTDIIKTLAQLYGIIFKSDAYNESMYLVKFKEIADAKPLAKNWTAKLDERSFQLNYRDKYGQKNWMRYQEDEGVTHEIGDYYFLIDDETIDAEKDVFQLPFAASDMVKRLIDLDVPLVNKLDESGDYNVETIPRLLIDNTKNITGVPIDFTDGVLHVTSTSDIPLCYFSLITEIFNIDFKTLMTLNYLDLVVALDKYKKIIEYFKLTEIDISELDHFIPVYTEQHSSYFYINKVDKYTGLAGANKGLTKVELIKI